MRDIILEEDLNITAAKAAVFAELHGSTVLVTGGTGLIGSQIVKALLVMNREYRTGIKVIAMVRDVEKALRVYGDDGDLCGSSGGNDSELCLVGCDLERPVATKDFPPLEGNVDYIIHTASPTASGFFVEHPVETLRTAFEGTANILEFAREKRCRGMVYLSSMEAFGITDPSLDTVGEEDLGYIDIHHVRSSYSEGKRACELLCSCYAAEYGLPVQIARLAQTFGAGVPYEENRVFAQFAKSVINRTDIVLHTKGLSVGNYCYTRDAVVAILTLLVRGEPGEAYTIANEDSAVTIAGMAQMVAGRIAGGKINVVFDIPDDAMIYGYAPDVTMHLSSGKMRSLGWEPEVGLEESYRRMIASMMATRE